VPERSRLHATGWVAVVLVALGAIVAQAFGRFTYSALLPAIRNDLGHSNTVAGFLGTVNVTAYLLGTFVVASLTSRLRLLTVFRSGFVFTLSGLAGAAFSPNAATLAVSLFAMGIGGAMIWIPSPALAVSAIGNERRGSAMGVIGAGIGAGIVFSGQMTRVLRDRSGDSAWRDVYRIELLLAIVAVIAIIAFVRHRQDAPVRTKGALVGFALLRTMPGWRALTSAYAAYGFSYLLALSFLTSRLEDDAGFTEGRAATMFALVGVGGILGGLLIGASADRVGERRTLTAGFACFAVALAAVMTGNVALVAVGSVLIGMMFSGLASVIAGYVVGHTSAETFGPIYAATTLAFGVAQLSSPQVGGLVADVTGSFTVVFILAIVFSLVGSIASSRLPAD
jgi:predicted MFS family arabinose efflux permease